MQQHFSQVFTFVVNYWITIGLNTLLICRPFDFKPKDKVQFSRLRQLSNIWSEISFHSAQIQEQEHTYLAKWHFHSVKFFTFYCFFQLSFSQDMTECQISVLYLRKNWSKAYTTPKSHWTTFTRFGVFYGQINKSIVLTIELEPKK